MDFARRREFARAQKSVRERTAYLSIARGLVNNCFQSGCGCPFERLTK